MEFLPKKLPAFIVITALCVALFCFAGCRYHYRKHVDTFKKDMNSMHKDIDRLLGIDEPSTLVED